MTVPGRLLSWGAGSPNGFSSARALPDPARTSKTQTISGIVTGRGMYRQLDWRSAPGQVFGRTVETKGHSGLCWFHEHLDRRMLLPEDFGARDLQPLVEKRGVHAAKVGVELEIAVVEIRQARMSADRAGAYGVAHDEHL